MRPAEKVLEVVPNNEDRYHYNLTDMGNAERLVAQHGQDVRYCYPLRKWLVWTGPRWQLDDYGKVHRLAKETVRGLYQEAAEAERESRRKELAKHATGSEAEARIRAMLELAKSEVPTPPDELDADPWVLNCKNGTVDLVGSGELMYHRREDLITKIAPVEYDKDAQAPTWEAFLERVLPSEELRAFVQRAVGYSLTGATSEQCMFINHGIGANGKSTFQETIAAALGDYALRTPTEMLLAKRSGSVPNDVARLKGARYVAASETEEGRRLAESLVKDLTGQDTITARFMRAEFFDFTPTHKLWLSTNHKPEIRGTDNAIWRRIRLIPWSVTIPPAEQDNKLLSKLRKELPGVLAWAVRGCLQWQEEGLGAPEEVRRATGEYRAEMDPLRDFFAERCVIADDAWAMAADLLAAYDRWRVPNNEPEITMTKFGRMLAERGFRKARAKSGPDRGKVLYTGIGLRTDGTPPDGGPNPSRREGFAENPSHEKSAANTGKSSGDAESVKSSEGKTQLTAGNSLAGDYVEKPFTTLHRDQTLHTSEEVGDPNQLVEERTAGLEKCIHGVVGGCHLCNQDEGGA
jgi:putative DNA primase/helicase